MPFPSNTKDLDISGSFPGDSREKLRITAIFSVATLENLNDYYAKD